MKQKELRMGAFTQRSMISFRRATMTLLLAVFTTMAWATDYITDVIVLGHQTSEGIASICNTYRNKGYTIISFDLNFSLNDKPCVYLGYKTTNNPTSGNIITDFYIRGASSNVSNNSLTFNGHTYKLAQFDGDSGFTGNRYGDLNYGAGGDYIHLFYTKEHFDDWRLVTGITINQTQSGAIGQNGGSTGYSLNNGCSGATAIYMHITTARGPIFLEDAPTAGVTAINGDVLTGTNSNNQYLDVRIANGATVTLNGVNIVKPSDTQGTYGDNITRTPGITCEGDATIILAAGTTNNVTGCYERAGIFIPKDHTLTIRGTGTLNANCNGTHYGTGIGSNWGNPGGSIVIESGIINANGYAGAGIGGGSYSGPCQNIIIRGGTVTATGHEYGSSGIGATHGGSCGNITISGGTVTATGSEGAAGIGAGSLTNGSCGNITISDGTVIANGGKEGAGIGGGHGGSCLDITISGGTVTSSGGYGGAGIGSAVTTSSDSQSSCGDINITNGVTRVTATGGDNAASIGNGHTYGTNSGHSQCGSVTIGGVSTGNISQKPFVTYPYKVAFNKNGGSGSMANQNFMYGVAQDLSTNAFTYDAVHHFVGWATSANGAVEYTDGQNVSNLTTTTNATVTLYAKWFYGKDLATATADYTAIDGDYLVGTLGENHKICIADGATVTLSNISINADGTWTAGDYAGLTCLGDATIILEDGSVNNVKGFSHQYAGIYVPKDKTLTIKGSGTLNASCNTSNNLVEGAGIGASANYNCGNIVIENGIVTATGGRYAAGIGSSQAVGVSSCGNITISGGTVTATGGYEAAGIGSGPKDGSYSSSKCGNITISGGSVTTTGGNGAPGIGSGYGGSSCGNITISGGTVVANPGVNAASIGSGRSGSSCGNITITNNVTSVKVTKDWNATSSIGKSYNGSCGTVTIGGVETGEIDFTVTYNPTVNFNYTVHFDKNKGTGTMDDQAFIYGFNIKLAANTFVRSNWSFAGWARTSDGSVAYTNEQSVKNLATTQGEVVTLYAVWNGIEVVLADGTSYSITEDTEVSPATYRKTIEENRVGKYQAWLVPFDYTITTDDEAKFTFYKISMIANAPAPGEGESSDEMWVYLTKVSAGSVLHANMPYLYKPKVIVTDYPFSTVNATLKAKNTGVLAETQTMEDSYKFYAVYENTTPAASDPFYYMNINGGISLGNNGEITVGPYRWIIRKVSKYGETTSYARSMRFVDEEEATSISEKGIVKSDKYATAQWYTLDGRELDGKPTQRGIYIVNGKKVVIK